MEKLKCTSCNGDLDILENGFIAECKYCGTKYKLEGNKTVVINVGDFDKLKSMVDTSAPKAIVRTSKAMIVLIMIGVVAMIIFGSYYYVSSNNRMEVRTFNSQFELYHGSQLSSIVYKMLYDIQYSNSKDNKHKITVVYKDKEYKTDEELSELINMIGKLNTTVSFKVKNILDNDGYINKIIIEEIK